MELVLIVSKREVFTRVNATVSVNMVAFYQGAKSRQQNVILNFEVFTRVHATVSINMVAFYHSLSSRKLKNAILNFMMDNIPSVVGSIRRVVNQ